MIRVSQLVSNSQLCHKPRQHKKRILGELLDATDVWAQHKSVSWCWASAGRYAKKQKNDLVNTGARGRSKMSSNSNQNCPIKTLCVIYAESGFVPLAWFIFLYWLFMKRGLKKLYGSLGQISPDLVGKAQPVDYCWGDLIKWLTMWTRTSMSSFFPRNVLSLWQLIYSIWVYESLGDCIYLGNTPTV